MRYVIVKEDLEGNKEYLMKTNYIEGGKEIRTFLLEDANWICDHMPEDNYTYYVENEYEIKKS